MSKKKSEIKSFMCAFSGIRTAAATQKHVRFHIVAAIYALWLSHFYALSKAGYCVLILTIASVIAAELFNTAIESCVDIASPQYSELAKTAKDVSAGAVLILAIFAAAVGVILFFDIGKLREIFNIIVSNPAYLIAFIISVILSVIFVLAPKPNKNKETNKKYGK